MKKSYTLMAVAFASVAILGLALTSASPAAAQSLFDGLKVSHETGMLFVGAGLIVNHSTLSNLFTGFKAIFQNAFAAVKPQHEIVVMRVISTTSAEDYGWLGHIPGYREWLGDRVVNNLSTHEYTIKNKDFESTVGVDSNHIKDDKLGIYSPMFSQMGRNAATFVDKLVWPFLKSGFTTTCYDGQYFFDTDHPVIDETGAIVSVANTDGGSGAAWFLMDDTQAIKPVIFQDRQAPDFVAMDQPTDEKVFSTRLFRYGSHARANVGFGLWQLIWGSKQTLDAAHFKTAYESLAGLKDDHGEPLGIMGRKLVVGPTNIEAAKKVVGTQELAGGGTNPWYGTAEVVVVPWLA